MPYQDYCLPYQLSLTIMVHYELLQHLRHINSGHTEPSAFEVLRGTFLSSMLVIFTEHLQAPHTLPLHESFYFDEVGSLHKHLAPGPRATLQAALTDPWHYLHVEDLEQTTEEHRPEQPDLCTIYSLYLECGKLINLYDWLQVSVAFTYTF